MACSSLGQADSRVEKVLGGLVGRSSEVRGLSMMCRSDVLVVFVSYIVRLKEKVAQGW